MSAERWGAVERNWRCGWGNLEIFHRRWIVEIFRSEV